MKIDRFRWEMADRVKLFSLSLFGIRGTSGGVCCSKKKYLGPLCCTRLLVLPVPWYKFFIYTKRSIGVEESRVQVTRWRYCFYGAQKDYRTAKKNSHMHRIVDFLQDKMYINCLSLCHHKTVRQSFVWCT